MLEYKLKKWKEVVHLDFPPLRVTEKLRENMIKYARRHSVGDARLAMGRFYTDAEYEARRKRILSTPLP